jgi:hypothetical protein
LELHCLVPGIGQSAPSGEWLWRWVKDKLTPAAGTEAVRDFENQPEDGRYHDAATVALSWLLRADPNALAELSHLFDLEGSVTELRNRLSHLGRYGCEKALAGAECEEVLATIQEAIAISRRLDQTR